MKSLLYKIRFAIAVIVFVLIIAAVFGIIYSVKILDLQLMPLIQRVMAAFSIISVILLSVIVIPTLLFGRIYCSLLCPLGVFQDIISCFSQKDSEKRKNLPFKYFILAITIVALLGGSVLIIKYIEPNTYFTSALTLSVIGLIVIILIGVLAFFKKRLFCTDICPVGAILGLISKVSLFKMYIDKNECIACGMCERNCPASCIDSTESDIENVTCLKCYKCMSVCPKNAIQYGIKPKH